MKLLILACTYLFIASCTCRRDYSGYKLVEITMHSENDIVKLEEVQQNNPQVSFWKLPHSVGGVASCAVSPDDFADFTEKLQQHGFDYTVTHNDLGEEIEKERQELAMMAKAPRVGFDIFRYNRHSDINGYLEELVQKCGEKGLSCEIINIGQSYEGREMNVIKIGSGGVKPGIWIDAGIHAREWIAPATAIIIANRLIYMYNVDSETASVLDYFDWYILPSANPDGYEYSWDEDRLWRKTRSPNEGSICVGADPNRNWDFHWMEAGVSSEPCSDIYGGSEPFSEIETENIANFLLNKDLNLKMYISLHAYGQFWLTPWGYTEDVPEDYDTLVHLGNVAAGTIYDLYGREFTVGSATRVLYAAAGSSMDWVKAKAGINYAIAAELRDTGRFGFLLPARQIKPVGRETWLGIRSMAKEIIDMNSK